MIRAKRERKETNVPFKQHLTRQIELNFRVLIILYNFRLFIKGVSQKPFSWKKYRNKGGGGKFFFSIWRARNRFSVAIGRNEAILSKIIMGPGLSQIQNPIVQTPQKKMGRGA